MTKKFNSRLVEWVNELGQDRLKAMKALEKRMLKGSDSISDEIELSHFIHEFGCDDYKIAKLVFDGIINNLKKLPTKKCPFCQGTIVDNSDAVILKPYMESFWLSAFAGSYRSQGDEHVWLGNFTWTCYDCETLATHPPKETAKIWLNTPEMRKKKIFASSVFKKFPEVKAMSLEGAAGRGWLIQLNESWYSNSRVKGELELLWILSN